jgi:hypothetical protein
MIYLSYLSNVYRAYLFLTDLDFLYIKRARYLSKNTVIFAESKFLSPFY